MKRVPRQSAAVVVADAVARVVVIGAPVAVEIAALAETKQVIRINYAAKPRYSAALLCSKSLTNSNEHGAQPPSVASSTN